VLDLHTLSVFIVVARYHIFGLVQTCNYLPVILSFESSFENMATLTAVKGLDDNEFGIIFKFGTE